MIHKFLDFLCVTAGILIVWSLVQQVKRNFEEIKAYQTTWVFVDSLKDIGKYRQMVGKMADETFEQSKEEIDNEEI